MPFLALVTASAQQRATWRAVALDKYIRHEYISGMSERTANMLGALALGLTDEIVSAVRSTTNLSPSACAALATLGPYPGSTIGAVAQVLGVTHSVAVRLIDELVENALVERNPGVDRRRVELRLTAAGSRLRDAIISARQLVLEDVMRSLTTQDRVRLKRIVSKLLTALTTSRSKADEVCRLCDEFICVPQRCPVELEAIRLAEGNK